MSCVPMKHWLTMLIMSLSSLTAMGFTFGLARGDDLVLIRAKHVVVGDGKVLSPGAVLVDKGKITVVAESIETEGAKVVEADWIMPGLVNAAASYGVSGGNSELSVEVAPDFRTALSIDPDSRDFLEAFDQGVTTAHIIPGTDCVIGGCSCIVKTTGGGASGAEVLMLADQHGLAIALSSDPTLRNQSRGRPDTVFMRQPTNRMGVVWILRSTLHQTKTDGESPYLSVENRAIISAALDGKMPIYSTSRKDVDIRSLFTLQDEFGIQPIVIGGSETYRIIDAIRERKPTIVLTEQAVGARASSLRGQEGTEKRWNLAGQLAQDGIEFCLAGGNLLDQARFASRFGLSREQAIAAITLQPAKILKLDQQLGSISVNKDADILAFNGDPLEFTSGLQWVMVNGKVSTK
jgi:imidazolonepropionase-like amidohydrolase